MTERRANETNEQWTPGPWHQTGHGAFGPRELWGDHDGARRYMGELDCSDVDARLIAAAPEMAAMLRQCIEACEGLDSDRENWPTIKDAAALLARIENPEEAS